MYPESEVRTVEVNVHGVTHTGTYFVERGVIVAKLNEQIMRVPLGQVDPQKTVEALLTGQAERSARMSKHRDEWSSATVETEPRKRGRPRLVEPEA